MSRPGASPFRGWILASILAATAAACSSGANTLPTAGPTATLAAPSGAVASALPSGALTDPAQAWPAYAACLRSHGLQVPDPEVDDNGDAAWPDPNAVKLGLTPKIEADCGPILASMIRPGARKRPSYTYESQLAHAACIREHGLSDWPDPDPNDRADRMPAGFDKRDPRVYTALVACERLLVETTVSSSPTP